MSANVDHDREFLATNGPTNLEARPRCIRRLLFQFDERELRIGALERRLTDIAQLVDAYDKARAVGDGMDEETESMLGNIETALGEFVVVDDKEAPT